MTSQDYYRILGVARTASEDEIKRAYRRLARKYHPDVSKETDADDKFKVMKEAYEVLKDPEKRAAYDRFGSDEDAILKTGHSSPWASDFPFRYGFHAYDTRGSVAAYWDIVDSLFGVGRGHRYRDGFAETRIDGEDITASITITLDEAYHGTTRQIALEIPTRGTAGRRVFQRKTLSVRIPKGVTAGQRIRLESQGNRGVGRGAEAGDLYLTVQFEPHPVFMARGKDIHTRLPVTSSEVALGRTVKAPTLGGPVDLTIPAGAYIGKTLRLKGRGLPGNPPGHQYVELVLKVSCKVTS